MEGTKTSGNEHTLAERVPHNSVQTYDFQRRKNPIPSAHRHTYICTHALTHFLILSFTLVFYTPSLAAGDIAREAWTLVNSLS